MLSGKSKAQTLFSYSDFEGKVILIFDQILLP